MAAAQNAMALGCEVPDFEAETTQGTIKWHSYIAGSWAILFSHPADFTPVCTTELGAVADLMGEFENRGVKVAALSCDTTEHHKEWIKDIEATEYTTSPVSYPIISDPKREIAAQYGMLDPAEKDAKGIPLTCRAVFVINPQKKLALSILYPATTGRNFDEVLRVIDSLQLTATKSVATPANWTKGKTCMVLPTVSDDDAKKAFPRGFKVTEVPSGKRYLRITPDPSS